MQTNVSDAKSIFVVAIEKYKPSEWPIYLDGACGEDGQLRAEVEALLDAHRQADSFLDRQTADLPEISEENIGTKIGPFKLLQKIGEGGFGVVYMAEQMKPIRRKVALKIIKPGMDSKDVIARFEAERQALAMMDHPNIAKVLDAGTTETSRPYFAMELVKGVSITDYADQNHLATKERLQLFAAVCRAVQHAHQKGVIHRDLKPSNVMVTLHDGQPVAKVIDFGVSKAMSQPLTEQTLFTRYGQVIGTPQYMSPEQAEMSGLDVDTRSDIYSLGVILYELLTGRTPFLIEQIRAAGFDEMRRLIREQDPVRPSNVLQTLDADTATTVASNRSARPDSLQKIVRGELDWIVMRTLEKDRNRRYDSASSLADDIDRHLNDEAVEASPPSLTYNMWKAYRRNRGAFAAGFSIAAALLLATTISLIAMRSSQASARLANNSRLEAIEQQQLAEEAKADAEEQRTEAELAKVQADTDANSSKQTLALLLSVFSKANRNPATEKPYTVREALMELSNLSLTSLSPSDGTEVIRNRLTSHMLGKIKPETVVELNVGLAEAFRSTGNFDLATAHAAKALDYLERSGSNQDLKKAECLRYIGFYNGDETKIQQAIEIERKLEETNQLVASLTLLGRHFARQKLADETKEVLSEAVSLFQPHRNLQLDEVPHFYLARLHRRQLGELSQANQLDAAAAKCVADSLGGTEEEWLQAGKTLRGARNLDQAELAFLVSAALHDSDDDPSFAAYELGKLYRKLNNDYDFPDELGRSAEYFRKCRETLSKEENEWAWIDCTKNLAEVYHRNGQDEYAIPLAKELIEARINAVVNPLSYLKLIAMDNEEVETWLSAEQEKLLEELKHSDGPLEARNRLVALAAYACFDDELDKCVEYLGEAGYSVFKLGSYHKLASIRGYPDAALAYTVNTLLQFEYRDRKDVEWILSNIARKRYHCSDLAGSVPPLREALELSREREKKDEFLHYWMCYELGLVLHQSEPEEARDLFKEAADGLAQAATEGRIIWWDECMDRATQIHCKVLSAADFDALKLEHEIQQRISALEDDFPRFVLQRALADLRLSQGKSIEALESLETAVSDLANTEYACPVWMMLDQLVSTYAETNQLQRGKDYFAKLVAEHDASLPGRHPRRAFLRVHLADILLQLDGQKSEAKRLLLEAQSIFELHEIIPEHVHAKVADMLAEATDSTSSAAASGDTASAGQLAVSSAGSN